MQYLGTPHPFLADVLPADFRAGIFDLAETAWLTLTDPMEAWLEPRITGLLRLAMIATQEAQYAGDPPFFILEEVKKRDPITGKETKRSDIEIHLRHFYITGQKPFFVFESKRLNVPRNDSITTNATKYVGTAGMGCLVNGQYQNAPSFSGMLAYVMDGNVTAARSAINRALPAQAATLGLTAPNALQKAKLIPAGNHRNETRHQGPSGEYAIFHLFLPLAQPA
jgi:hypothetical protein